MNAAHARLEVVVARYTESLNWLRNAPDRVRKTVYDKHPTDPYPGAICLPNVGREAHTYLTHLLMRYDCLSDYTVFCQGKPFDHAYDFHHRLREFAQQPDLIGDFCWLGHQIDTDDDAGLRLFKPWSKNDDGRGLDLRGFHQTLFDTHGPAEYSFVLGAQFAIRRDVVLRRSRAFYEKALEVAIAFPDAAHCFERSWDRVFGLTGLDPEWLAGRKTVALKPVREKVGR